jgi:hypothetical protein
VLSVVIVDTLLYIGLPNIMETSMSRKEKSGHTVENKCPQVDKTSHLQDGRKRILTDI